MSTSPGATPIAPIADFEKAGVLSRISGSWLSKLLSSGRKGKLEENALLLPVEQTADDVTQRFLVHWEQELTGSHPSLLKALRKTFLRSFLIASTFKLFWGIFVLVSAFYFVNSLLNYLADANDHLPQSDAKGWLLSCFFFLSCLLMSISLQQMFSYSSRVGLQIRASLLTAVYRKAIKQDPAASSGLGDIVSLAAVDCLKVLDGCLNIHYIWSGPLEASAILGLLLYLLGVNALPAVALVFLILPVQVWIGKKVTALRREMTFISERRVQRMYEIILSIKLVKLYNWVKWFSQSIEDVRVNELSYLRRSALYKSFNLMLVFILPPAIALIIFSVVSHADGQLKPAIVFTVLSLFNTLRFPLVVLPKALKSVAESMSSIDRLQAFLLRPDAILPSKSSKIGIRMENADLGYGEKVVLKNVNVNLSQGQLLAVLGPVGCGKSTLFAGALGQATPTKGTVEIGGKIAYVSQVPWVQHGTVRDNILFGRPYNAEFYQKVVFACALETDFRILLHGDMTELGERGISLSGGQRQRIALARAVYSEADIYILDQPLSAVDQHTCNHIFDHCIKGLLGSKTVMLGAHQLYLLPRCDVICSIKPGGIISYCGPYDEAAVIREFPEFEQEIKAQKSAKELEVLEDSIVDAETIKLEETKEQEDGDSAAAAASSIEVASASDVAAATAPVSTPVRSTRRSLDVAARSAVQVQKPQPASGIVTKKDEEKGAEATGPTSAFAPSSGSDAYKDWFRSAGFGLSGVSLFFFGAAQITRIISDWWISRWSRAPAIPEEQDYHMWAYLGFVVAFGILLLVRGLVFYYASLRSATRLHNDMFSRVLRAPFLFFTVTPLGKLLNAFAKEQDVVDEALPDAAHMTLIYAHILATTLILVCIQLPYFAIVAVILLLSFLVFQKYFLSTARTLKSFAGVAGGELFTHLSESLYGLPVIRAFEAEDRFIRENIDLVDRQHRALFTLDQVHTWLAFRLDFIGSALVLATSLMLVGLRDSLDQSASGLAISNSFQMLVFFTWVVRGFAEVDSLVSSVSRISYYATQTELEPQLGDKALKVAKNWPPEGKIEFDNVTMSYFPGAKPALRGVSFTVQPGEKIGVVGRTGSGKSTLLMSLFRLCENSSGRVIIDGVDTNLMSQDELRGAMTIVPQEPTMFCGTLRSNLDPFNQYTDSEIWQALRLSSLYEIVNSLPLKLESPVAENGSNISLGQRQLYCLCRVVLKKSKILVLDEATAAIDSQTEALVQKTVSECFADRTMMTIAHRLDTIINSDKILFMDAGKVLEFDTPYKLLSDPNSNFCQMVEQTGMAAERLRQAAAKFEEERHGSAGRLLSRRASLRRLSLTPSRASSRASLPNWSPGYNPAAVLAQAIKDADALAAAEAQKSEQPAESSSVAPATPSSSQVAQE